MPQKSFLDCRILRKYHLPTHSGSSSHQPSLTVFSIAATEPIVPREVTEECDQERLLDACSLRSLRDVRRALFKESGLVMGCETLHVQQYLEAALLGRHNWWSLARVSPCGWEDADSFDDVTHWSQPNASIKIATWLQLRLWWVWKRFC